MVIYAIWRASNHTAGSCLEQPGISFLVLVNLFMTSWPSFTYSMTWRVYETLFFWPAVSLARCRNVYSFARGHIFEEGGNISRWRFVVIYQHNLWNRYPHISVIHTKVLIFLGCPWLTDPYLKWKSMQAARLSLCCQLTQCLSRAAAARTRTVDRTSTYYRSCDTENWVQRDEANSFILWRVWNNVHWCQMSSVWMLWACL